MRNWIDIDADKVLQALQDHSGLTWADLCEKCGFSSRASHPGPMSLYNCLMSLADAGLVTVDDLKQSAVKQYLRTSLAGESTKKFRASDLWVKIQMVLNMRYLGAPRPRVDYSMLVQPRFGPPIALPKRTDIFVLMPFASTFEAIYRERLVAVAVRLNLTITRADDLFTPNTIVEDVWSGICGAGVIVADCTDRNANVFYEIGIAHTVGKPVILIAQRDEDIPADLGHIKYIRYEASEAGLQQLELSLAKTVHATLGIYEGMFSDGAFKNSA